jgi:hypothetical protein
MEWFILLIQMYIVIGAWFIRIITVYISETKWFVRPMHLLVVILER